MDAGESTQSPTAWWQELKDRGSRIADLERQLEEAREQVERMNRAHSYECSSCEEERQFCECVSRLTARAEAAQREITDCRTIGAGLVADNKKLEARAEAAEARNAHLEKSTEEACIELKEWRIRFPHTDPTIARRMVEDRAKAEAIADSARGEGESE